MKTHWITLTSKGQVTLPVEFRRELGLAVHDQIAATIVDGLIILKPPELTLEDVIGSIPTPAGLRTGDFEEIIQEAALEETANLTREFLKQGAE